MCYTIPTVGAIISSFIWHRRRQMKLWWLNLMFYGGAIFGVIDHLWNRELFIVSENWLKDLLLGVVISMGILLFWLVILILNKVSLVSSHYIEASKIRP